MRRLLLWMFAIAMAIDVAYWTIWFTNRDWLASVHRQAYYEFENAFPLADVWLGIACLLAFLSLWHGQQRASIFWVTCAGAAGLYLFGMDFLYDLEHGIFTQGGGGAIEALIVALTLVFSLVALRYAWRALHALPVSHQS